MYDEDDDFGDEGFDIERYDGYAPDGNGWEDYDWPDGWDDYSESEGWEIYDIEINVEYGET